MSLVPLAAAIAAGVSCSSTSPSGTLELVTGQQAADPFTQAPAPVTLKVQQIDWSVSPATTTVLAQVALPTSTINLGALSQSTVATIEVTGLDSTRPFCLNVLPVECREFERRQHVRVRSANRPACDDARHMDGLTSCRPSPALAVWASQYLFVGGGTSSSQSTSAEVYDLASFTATSGITMPIAPTAVAFTDTYLAWLIGDTAGYYYDFSGGYFIASPYSSAFTLPTGGGIRRHHRGRDHHGFEQQRLRRRRDANEPHWDGSERSTVGSRAESSHRPDQRELPLRQRDLELAQRSSPGCRRHVERDPRPGDRRRLGHGRRRRGDRLGDGDRGAAGVCSRRVDGRGCRHAGYPHDAARRRHPAGRRWGDSREMPACAWSTWPARRTAPRSCGHHFPSHWRRPRCSTSTPPMSWSSAMRPLERHTSSGWPDPQAATTRRP